MSKSYESKTQDTRKLIEELPDPLEETLFMRISHLISDIVLLSVILIVIVLAISYSEVRP